MLGAHTDICWGHVLQIITSHHRVKDDDYMSRVRGSRKDDDCVSRVKGSHKDDDYTSRF